MSFLQNQFRQHSWIKKDRLSGIVNVPDEKEIWQLENTAEQKRDQTGLLPFNTAMDNLLSKLQQAELQGDFKDKLKNKYAKVPQYIDEVTHFIKKANQIKEKLRLFYAANQNYLSELKKEPDADNKLIQQWLTTIDPNTKQSNAALIADFLVDLDNIYKQRRGWAKFKDAMWELADATVLVLAAVGLVAGVLKLAGAGIFGGAFAHFVAPVSTAKIVMGATAGVSVAATGLFKALHSDKAQLEKAIQKNLERPFELANSKKKR